MILVHHLANSRSQRVLWLLEELGVPYEIKRYERDPKTMLAPAELRRVHPLGKSPVITDGELTVAESGAIVDYLVDRYDPDSKLRPPPSTPERLRYSYFLHFAEGSAMPPLLVKLIFDRVRTAPLPFFVRPVAKRIASAVDDAYTLPNIERHLAFMESELASRPWFAGESFSAADVQMSFPIEASVRAGLDARHPRLRDFIARIHARPAYRRALERGGPYEYAE